METQFCNLKWSPNLGLITTEYLKKHEYEYLKMLKYFFYINHPNINGNGFSQYIKKTLRFFTLVTGLQKLKTCFFGYLRTNILNTRKFLLKCIKRTIIYFAPLSRYVRPLSHLFSSHYLNCVTEYRQPKVHQSLPFFSSYPFRRVEWSSSSFQTSDSERVSARTLVRSC